MQLDHIPSDFIKYPCDIRLTAMVTLAIDVMIHFTGSFV